VAVLQHFGSRPCGLFAIDDLRQTRHGEQDGQHQQRAQRQVRALHAGRLRAW
jgi:hypothetical protein